MKRILTVITAVLLISISTALFSVNALADVNIDLASMSIEELNELRDALNAEYSERTQVEKLHPDMFNGVAYIVGVNIPAGRYLVTPEVFDESLGSDLYAKVRWWDADQIENPSCTDYVCAEWTRAIELTDGAKVEFLWDKDQLGTYIVLRKLPEAATSLFMH